jgi:hypothetical protein
MAELVTVYGPGETDVSRPMDRDMFYAHEIEHFRAGTSSGIAIEVIQVLLVNESHQFIVQMRSENKRHNAGLLDKSIGGHVKYGDSVIYTVNVETVQELRVPSLTLATADDFKKTLQLLKEYLSTVAIVRHIDTRTEILRKLIGNELVPILHRVHFFLGVYGGAVKNVDAEASGVLFLGLDRLREKVERQPEQFSDDLRHYLATRKVEIDEFFATITSVLQPA